MSKSKRPSAEKATLPLVEEEVRVDKREVTAGKVRVVTHTETIEEVARAVLDGEEAEVSAIEIDQQVTGPVPQIRTVGDVTIVPVLEEVLVVEKRLVLKREIHIRMRKTSESVEVPVSLRKQQARVERE